MKKETEKGLKDAQESNTARVTLWFLAALAATFYSVSKKDEKNPSTSRWIFSSYKYSLQNGWKKSGYW